MDTRVKGGEGGIQLLWTCGKKLVEMHNGEICDSWVKQLENVRKIKNKISRQRGIIKYTSWEKIQPSQMEEGRAFKALLWLSSGAGYDTTTQQSENWASFFTTFDTI